MLGVFLFSCLPITSWQEAIAKHLPEKLWKLNMTALKPEKELKMFMSEKIRKAWNQFLDSQDVRRRQCHEKRYGADRSSTEWQPLVNAEAFFVELKKLANNPVPGMHRYMENAVIRKP